MSIGLKAGDGLYEQIVYLSVWKNLCADVGHAVAFIKMLKQQSLCFTQCT